MKNKVIIAIVLVLVAVGAWLLLKKPVIQNAQPDAPKLSIIYNVEELPGEKSLVVQVIQSQLKEAGFEVTLDPVPSGTYYDRTGKSDFDGAFTLWYLDYDDAEGFLTDFYSQAGYRLSKYSSPQYDSTYLAALFATTEEEKLTKYREAAAILDHDLPWVPLYSNSELFLLRPDMEGFKSNAYQYYDYRRAAVQDIRVASDVEPGTLDPALAYDLASKHIVTQSYEGLIALDEGNKIVPSLATSWAFSDAGDALTFELRPNVRFHETAFRKASKAMAASDVKVSFERLIKANSPYSYIFDHVVGIDEFKNDSAPHVTGFVVDAPLRFTIKLKQAFPTMLPWLLAPAAYVLPAEVPRDFDVTKGSCGTGPFVLTGWDGSVARFNANRVYWLSDNGTHLPLAKTLSIRIMKDASSLLAAYEQHSLDILSVPLPLFDAVLDKDGKVLPKWSTHRFREVKLNNLKFIGFNMLSQTWGGDPALRQRVSDALDRQEIVRELFKGKARAATSIVPSGMAGFN